MAGNRGKTIKLSISLLATDGREGTLKRCLSSLQPLRDSVPSELVAVYTGESGEPLGILERHGARIIPFSWCDDFSKARNAGLSECTGEWFMYIDDDEWFEDVSELAEFFKGRKCDRYNTASYIVRSYAGQDHASWHDVRTCRLCRREGLSFTGVVHEQMTPLRPPEKFFGCHVHHSGYIFRTDEEQAAHHRRNTRLLLQALEEQPGDIRLLAHLANEYRGSDIGKFRELCDDVLDRSREYEGNNYYEWIMAILPEGHAREGGMEQAVEAAAGLLRDRKLENPYARAYIAAHGTARSESLRDLSSEELFLDTYMQAVSEIEQSPDKLANYNMFTLGEQVSVQRKNEILLYGIKHSMVIGDLAAALSYTAQICWKDIPEGPRRDFGKMAVAKVIQCACELKQIRGLHKILEKAMEDPEITEAVFDTIEACCQGNPECAGALLKEVAATSVFSGENSGNGC